MTPIDGSRASHSDMKIFSICCVRDENDIIKETLEAALVWNDRIFVFDNASVDGTWETLQALAKQQDRIVLVGRDDRIFTEELRGDIFEAHRSVASAGDWWCRLDADEIYIDNPAAFLARIPARYGFVMSATFNYYFTDRDLRDYENEPSAWTARPVQERLRYYQNNWSEARFVRHHDKLHWKDAIWPPNRGLTYPGRIRLKHFQYRSPEQIARRLSIRQNLLEIFPHEANRTLAVPGSARTDWAAEWMKAARFETASWKDRLRRAEDCDSDGPDGTPVSRENLMPPLPSPGADMIRAVLQSTAFGRAVLSPVIRWRRYRRLGRTPR